MRLLWNKRCTGGLLKKKKKKINLFFCFSEQDTDAVVSTNCHLTGSSGWF